MKTNTVNLRVSETDEENLQKAAENLSILTDEKPSISKAIREAVKILAEKDANAPILFYVNRIALRDLELNLEYGLKHLKLIIDQYHEAIGSYPTIEEISNWFGTTRSNYLVANHELIKDNVLDKKHLEQKDKYPGLTFSKDNVILPDLEPLFDVCSKLIFIPGIEWKEEMFWQCYRVKEDQVEIIPNEIAAIKNRYRIYAITPDEKARLAVIQKLTTVMDTIKVSDPAQLNIPGFISYDVEAGVFTASENYIKGYIK